MTERRTQPLAELTTLADLPAKEAADVAALLARLDRDALAAAAGMTRDALDQIPGLSDMRGTFRTPYPLLGALCGYGHGGRPATSRGQVLTRLGFKVHPGGGIDKGNYHRLAAAADFFTLELPAGAKDGPAVGQSVRHDVVAFTAAWVQADTLTELARLLGQQPSGKTNTRNRARGAELGLPDKFSKAARAAATEQRRAERAAAAGPAVSRHPAGWFPRVPARIRERNRRDAHAVERTSARCRQCDGPVAQVTATGKTSWSKYCSDQCRHAYTEARRAADNLAAKAAAQQPCRVCGGPVVPGRRPKLYCGPACGKRAYELRKTTAAA